MKYTEKNHSKLTENIREYQMCSEPRIDGGNHTYPYQGKEYPSVSTILRVFALSDFIVDHPEIMDEAAVIGHAVHEAIATGNDTDDPMLMIDTRYMNCLKAYSQYFISRHIVRISSELEMVSPELEFGGTLDELCFIDGVLTLVDYKTGPVKYQDFIQLECYAMLLRQSFGIFVKDAILVQLNKTTGEYAIRRSPDRKKTAAFARYVVNFYNNLESFKRLVDGRRRLSI